MATACKRHSKEQSFLREVSVNRRGAAQSSITACSKLHHQPADLLINIIGRAVSVDARDLAERFVVLYDRQAGLNEHLQWVGCRARKGCVVGLRNMRRVVR